jgi:hypothetical protein
MYFARRTLIRTLKLCPRHQRVAGVEVPDELLAALVLH